MIVNVDTQNVTTYVVLRDGTTGEAITGAEATDISVAYTRTRSALVGPTALSALDGPSAAFSQNKCAEVDADNAPGVYRIDWPNEAFIAGAAQVILSVQYSNGGVIAYPENQLVELSTVSDALTQATNDITLAITQSTSDVTAAVAQVADLTIDGVMGGDVDSGLSLADAIKVCVAALMGNATYNSTSGVWIVYGQDGIEVARVKDNKAGNRTGSAIK